MPLDNPDTPRLDSRLRREVRGEVGFDAFTRGRYATDASIYQIEPLGVVVPRGRADAAAAIAIAREEGVPVLPRGAGTSQCGQTVARALVIDCSKHMDQVISVDIEARRARVGPGVVLDRLNRALRAHRLFFPVDPSTASRATLGGMTANNSCGSRSLRYGNMVHNVRGIDALLADGTTAWFGEVPGNFDETAMAERYRGLVCRMRSLHRREADEIARRFPQVLRRVGGYNIDSIDGDGSRGGHNMARLLVGSEGTLAFFNEIELELQPVPAHRVLGICHFPSFYRAMDATRQIVGWPECRGTGRPDDDRIVARHPDVPRRRRPFRRRRACGDPDDRILRRRCGGQSAALEGAGRADGRSRPARRGRRGNRAGFSAGGLGGARAGPQHHDVDERRRQAGLVSRRLRGAPRRPGRLYRAADPYLREARHLRHLVCPCLGRLPACAAGAERQAGARGQKDAGDRRGGVRHGPRIQRLAFGRAWRRAGALGIPRGDVRVAHGARLRGGQGRFRPGRPVQPRQDRPPAADGRPQPVPLQARLPCAADRHGTRLVGMGRLFGRGRDVQQQRCLPRPRCRGHVPVVSRHRRRAAPDPRPGQYVAARLVGAARPGCARLRGHARDDGAVHFVQGLPAGMPDRRRHGADEDRVSAPLRGAPPARAARPADRLSAALRPVCGARRPAAQSAQPGGVSGAAWRAAVPAQRRPPTAGMVDPPLSRTPWEAPPP